MTGTPAPRRPRRRSVRARIAVACAGLFLVLGGVLVGATYGIVSHNAQANFGYYPPTPGLPGPSRCPAGERLIEVVPPATDPSPRQACSDWWPGESLYEQAVAESHEFLVLSLAGVGVATLAAGGLGWAVSGRVLRPLRAITTAARAASQENLDQRLALTGPADELKELADTFDGMLARLDGAFASQQRFVANASHELRTPLTEMRTLIDVTLAEPGRPAAPQDGVLAGVRVAVDRSEELIEALLTLARSDRGLGETEVVDLPIAVEDAVDQASTATAARQVTIGTSLQPAQVTGDRVLLERLVTNLIDNAVRHNVPGGWVTAATRCEPGFAELTITNSGQPIPPDQVSGLFEPFRRLTGRAGSQPGAGLGLSIVASVARAHGGRAEARARPEGGLDIQIRLPATAPRNTNGAILAGAKATRPAPLTQRSQPDHPRQPPDTAAPTATRHDSG
jgi:signal transduction histidine kinase